MSVVIYNNWEISLPAQFPISLLLGPMHSWVNSVAGQTSLLTSREAMWNGENARHLTLSLAHFTGHLKNWIVLLHIQVAKLRKRVSHSYFKAVSLITTEGIFLLLLFLFKLSFSAFSLSIRVHFLFSSWISLHKKCVCVCVLSYIVPALRTSLFVQNM